MRTWKDNKSLLVVNLLAGPGIGKTCLSYDLTSLISKRGYNTERTGEYAKTMLWNRQLDLAAEQDFIFAQQHHKQRRYVNAGTECVISDSPLCLGLLYLPDDFPSTFKPFVLDAFDSYTNFNVHLVRNPNITYQQFGRFQNLEQAQEKDQVLADMIATNNINIDLTLMSQDGNDQIIFDALKQHFPERFTRDTK